MSQERQDDRIARIQSAILLLEELGGDWQQLDALDPETRQRLHQAIAGLHDPDPSARRRQFKRRVRDLKAQRIERAEERLSQTGIRELRKRPTFTTPDPAPPPALPAGDDPAPPEGGLRNCYVCKRPYGVVHHFYDQLCPECAAFNFAKRTELTDLSGRVALLTGGRVKIGYQASLKLLRSGATVIVTSRFPRDAASRYGMEPDFATWADRLEIHGLDLRHTPSVEAFCRHVFDSRTRLDFLINNACQTVRRPPQFYRHMMAAEAAAADRLPAAVRRVLGPQPGDAGAALTAHEARGGEDGLAGLTRAAALSQVALLPEDEDSTPGLFPEGALDQDLQQIDLRGRNSWRLMLDEVSSVELIEVQLINAIAPFVLNARLRPLMRDTPGREKHIVNVSAMEGQFYRRFKTTRHPHTNMAKAALNMMTRTSAADYYQDGIHMNSVDTGWVTDEDPEEFAARKTAEQRFHPPLDSVDGAARIVDPIIAGIATGVHTWGQFLKDYRPTHW